MAMFLRPASQQGEIASSHELEKIATIAIHSAPISVPERCLVQEEGTRDWYIANMATGELTPVEPPPKTQPIPSAR